MQKVKLSVKTIIGYILIMIIGITIKGFIIGAKEDVFLDLIILSIIQICSSGFMVYMIKRHFEWSNVGFNKMSYKNLAWFIPYVLILIFMGTTFVKEIYINIQHYDLQVWTTLFLTLIGTILAGYCEEVLFRGILLNSLIKEKNLILAMIISSIGFSILHITTIFNGASIIGAIYNVIYASLLGFAFVALAIKIKNIWPLVIYHILWNYLLIASDILNINVSKVSLLSNPLNILIGIILWYALIKENKKSKFAKLNSSIDIV